jgi:hypothetical protein
MNKINIGFIELIDAPSIFLFSYLYVYILPHQIEANPESSHGLRIRKNLEFYEGWLLPKIRSLFFYHRYLSFTQLNRTNGFECILIFFDFLLEAYAFTCYSFLH